MDLKGVYLGCRYGIPALMAASGGSVINTVSAAGLIGSRNRSHVYSAGKGGVIALTRAMAIAYARHGVCVNTICPGVVETPMIAPFLNTEERHRRFAALRPLACMGMPEDIVKFTLYLASDESSWMTGGIFPIDSGLAAHNDWTRTSRECGREYG